MAKLAVGASVLTACLDRAPVGDVSTRPTAWRPKPTPPYYHADEPGAAARRPGTARSSGGADVCVVGAGFTGLSCGLEPGRARLSGRGAGGASGSAGGPRAATAARSAAAFPPTWRCSWPAGSGQEDSRRHLFALAEEAKAIDAGPGRALTGSPASSSGAAFRPPRSHGRSRRLEAIQRATGPRPWDTASCAWSSRKTTRRPGPTSTRPHYLGRALRCRVRPAAPA